MVGWTRNEDLNSPGYFDHQKIVLTMIVGDIRSVHINFADFNS